MLLPSSLVFFLRKVDGRLYPIFLSVTALCGWCRSNYSPAQPRRDQFHPPDPPITLQSFPRGRAFSQASTAYEWSFQACSYVPFRRVARLVSNVRASTRTALSVSIRSFRCGRWASTRDQRAALSRQPSTSHVPSQDHPSMKASKTFLS